MLVLLKIRNLALVDELLWEIGPGLIGVTGETGAGKSVIIGALKLVLGERADKSLIRSGEETCTVEAVFASGADKRLSEILDEGGIDLDDDSLIIRRVISTKASRQFINDSPVTQALLKRIGQELVDLHGPHDHQSLLSTERQRSMLDAFAGNEAALLSYEAIYRHWKELSDQIDEIRQQESATDQELELLSHIVSEIDQANLDPDEERSLEGRWRRASNANRLRESCGEAIHRLNDEAGVLDQLGSLQKTVRDLERIDPKLGDWTLPLERALIELEDLASSLHDYLSDLEIDAQEIAEVEERMNLVEVLRRKYGSTFSEILDRRNQAAKKLNALENRDSRMKELQERLEHLQGQLESAAYKLSATRRRAAPRLAKEISKQLNDLGFKQSTFEIELPKLDQFSQFGAEGAEYHFGPNPGEPVLPLRQIASSGEISRVMLAVKTALAEQDSTPLMVFDEIDANVGGEIASAVGAKMAALGKRHQVVAITHFPQVAAKAQRHFVVEKNVHGGRTSSHLFAVEGEARVDELVRMLGGGGDRARSMASALLEE